MHARLGAGGMGQVFLGRSPGGRLVAVKVVRPELTGDAEFRRRFADEVRAARKVSGFYTAPVVDAAPDAAPPWLATAYIPGLSLHQAVAGHGPLPLESVAVLGAGLAEGLAAVHAGGIVHRDLKPGNVLLAEDGPRLIDFGIARALDATSYTQTSTVLGTAAYMSPEQARAQEAGPASDVFSLGCVLTFAATGRSPFGTGPVHAVLFRVVHEEPDLSDLPASLAGLVRACLAKKPGARPDLDGLRDYLASLAPSGPARAGGRWLGDDLTEVIAQHATRLYTLIETGRTQARGGNGRAATGPGRGRGPGGARDGRPGLAVGNLGLEELEIVMDGSVLGTVPGGTSRTFGVGTGAHTLQARAGARSGAPRPVTVGPSATAVAFDTPKRRSPPEPVETVTFSANKVSEVIGMGLSAIFCCVVLGLVLNVVAPNEYPPHPLESLANLLLMGSPLVGLVFGAVESARSAPWLTIGPDGLTWLVRSEKEAQRIAWADLDQVRLVGEGANARVIVWPGKQRPRPRGEPFQGGVTVCTARDIDVAFGRGAHRLRACLEWFPGEAK
ncbi:hypothetical protein DEF24_24240 [Marinitenerispora sediminis]|uniref:Protein kinase domain-containing protein n=1 Tax=Marinitenerispora sediminis TaxID=1931232 RepID=A0A368SZ48_9ACTN|nr:hypothetical protein DEF24_24240 [Marinitenerispora sediminis]